MYVDDIAIFISKMDNGISRHSWSRIYIFMLIVPDFILKVHGSHSVFSESAPLVNADITNALPSIACVFQGNMAVDITWQWRVGGDGNDPAYYFTIETAPFPLSGMTGISSSLSWKNNTILEERKKANGTLYASASHDGVTTSCTDVVLNLLWTPEAATILPQGSIDVVNGTSLSLECLSDDIGSPEGYAVWTKNSVTEYTNPVGQGNIVINPVTKDTIGNWTCHYMNGLGDGGSLNALDVAVIWPASDVVLNLNDKGPLEENDTLIMTCTAADLGNPPSTSSLYLDDKTPPNMQQFNLSTYTIYPITKDHNGQLKCCYTNDDALKVCSNTETILILWKPGKPQILTLSHTTLLRGDTLSLKCSLETDMGNPDASEVVWTFEGDIEHKYKNESLKVANITEEQIGEWACYYANSVGNGPSSDAVKVSLGRLPTGANLTSNSVAGNIALHTSLTLNCLTKDRGNPPGLVKWKKDFYFYEYNYYILTIENVVRNDSGIWDCFYQNGFGTGRLDRKYINIVWNVSTDGMIKLEAENPEVEEGDNVSLEYVLTDKGSPEARVSWTHNDTVKSGEDNYTLILEDVTFTDSGQYGCYANNNFSSSNVAVFTLTIKPRQGMQVWVYIVIAVCCGILLIVIIVIIICVVKKKKKNEKSDSVGHVNRSLQPDNMTGTGPANKPNVEAAAPVYAAVSRGNVLAPIAAGADGSVYSHVDLSKKTARQSLKGLPMSKKAIDRIIFHKKDGYVNMTFQVRKKFIGDIEIGVCRIGDQSCTSKVSKQHDGASKDVVMVLPIEDRSPDSYSIRIKFTERGQVTQTVDLTYPYNKNAVNVTVLNEVHGTNVSPSYADVEVEGVPSRPPRQGYPAEGVTYAVMDWDRSQAPGRPPRLSARSQAQEHVVYADVRPGGNVY